MIIAVDFDGTVVTHEYQRVGQDVDGAVETLRNLVSNGHQIILWTMRHGDTLLDAIKWYDDNGISLYGINENPNQDWSDSPKAYAHLYIDDAAIGCPLKHSLRGRPYVDWNKVSELLLEMDILQ